MALEKKREFASLIALEDDIEPKEYVLNEDICNIGRSSQLCDIVIKRKTVSRLHVKIEREGTHHVLYAIGRNPTFINKKMLEEPHILQNGDFIGLAIPDHILRFKDDDPTDLISWHLRYDENLMNFFIDDQKVALTPSQFNLLHYLYQNSETVCTREDCARAIWQDDYLPEYETDNLDKLISGLRKQLAQFAPNSNFIETHRGIGYIFHKH